MDFDFYESAKKCLELSAEMRSSNYKHSKFIGDVYFNNGHFNNAQGHYKNALLVVPYNRNTIYKSSFCGLSQEIRKSGLFGHFRNIDLICQEEESPRRPQISTVVRRKTYSLKSALVDAVVHQTR